MLPTAKLLERTWAPTGKISTQKPKRLQLKSGHRLLEKIEVMNVFEPFFQEHLKNIEQAGFSSIQKACEMVYWMQYRSSYHCIAGF